MLFAKSQGNISRKVGIHPGLSPAFSSSRSPSFYRLLIDKFIVSSPALFLFLLFSLTSAPASSRYLHFFLSLLLTEIFNTYSHQP